MRIGKWTAVAAAVARKSGHFVHAAAYGAANDGTATGELSPGHVDHMQAASQPFSDGCKAGSQPTLPAGVPVDVHEAAERPHVRGMKEHPVR